MVESTGWDRRLSVVADGKKLVGHAGAVLLRRCADRTGLTGALAGVLPSSTATGWRERAGVLVHLAIAIVLGAANFSEVEQLQSHHRPLFGLAASDSTARRTLAALDETVLAKIAKVRARVRRHVWSLLRLRPGSSGANTVADRIRVLTDALAQVPGPSAAKILVRVDRAGATHGLLEHLEALNTTRRTVRPRRGRRAARTAERHACTAALLRVRAPGRGGERQGRV